MRAGETRLRLREIGVGQFLDAHLLLHGFKLFLQVGHVVLLQVQRFRVAHHIHVGGNGVKQHALFGVDQLRTAGAHLGLGAAHFGHRAAAAIERLGDDDLARNRTGEAARYRRMHPVFTVGALRVDRRPPAGIGLRHLLVDRA